MTAVQGYCPMGCGQTLILSGSGTIVCNGAHCPRPGAVDELLSDRETEHVVQLGEHGYNLVHPLRERLDGQLLECTVGTWIGAQAPADLPPPGRYRAVEPVGDTVWERLS